MAKVKISDTMKIEMMNRVKAFLEGENEEVLQVKSGEYSIPYVVDGEEGYVNICFVIRNGERGGNGYDGHDEAENFALEQKAKAEAKAKADAERRAKAERDAKERKAKVDAKEKA